MAEGQVASCPQVFLVDSQATCFPPQPQPKPRRSKVLQKVIGFLVLLSLLGLVVEGCFIYKLFQKTESGVNNVEGARESHKEVIDLRSFELQQKKPVAHLMGSETPAGDQGVVQWLSEGEAVIKHMEYRDGRLIVKQEGLYYIYNKVQINMAGCSHVHHKVMKSTTSYGDPIELMTSMISHCPNSTRQSSSESGGEDNLQNSFLAGTFHLKSGDQIYVTLQSIEKLLPGHAGNYLGAFMIF